MVIISARNSGDSELEGNGSDFFLFHRNGIFSLFFSPTELWRVRKERRELEGIEINLGGEKRGRKGREGGNRRMVKLETVGGRYQESIWDGQVGGS